MTFGLVCFLAALAFFHVSEFALAAAYMWKDLSLKCAHSAVLCKLCEPLVCFLQAVLLASTASNICTDRAGLYAKQSAAEQCSANH